MIAVILFANSVTFISFAYGANLGIYSDSSCMVYIRNVNSGKYFDVQGGTVANGKEVQLYEGMSSAAQRWNICLEERNYYSIRSAVDQRYCLSVKGDKDVNGAKIVLKYVAKGSTVPDSAKFLIFDYPSYGCALIINKLNMTIGGNELRVLDAQQAGTANGTKLLHYTARDSIDAAAHQLWVFECDERFPNDDQGWDLVDLTGHCDWDGSSKYMSMVSKAANAWNAYIGNEVLRPDAWNRIEDVRIKDSNKVIIVSDDNVKMLAETSPLGIITFYTTPMDELESDLQRQKVVTHELGHALGIYEFIPDFGNIMCQGPFAYGTSLGLDDKELYRKASQKY